MPSLFLQHLSLSLVPKSNVIIIKAVLWIFMGVFRGEGGDGAPPPGFYFFCDNGRERGKISKILSPLPLEIIPEHASMYGC